MGNFLVSMTLELLITVVNFFIRLATGLAGIGAEADPRAGGN